MGFEVGLNKRTDNDVVCALRPIYANEQGEEILGQQHGTDVSRVQRVKAKEGYAVGAVTAKAATVVDGFSVTFMKIDKDRLDPKEAYESDWIGGKNSDSQTRLGGDGKNRRHYRPAERQGLHGFRPATGLGHGILGDHASRRGDAAATVPHPAGPDGDFAARVHADPAAGRGKARRGTHDPQPARTD